MKTTDPLAGSRLTSGDAARTRPKFGGSGAVIAIVSAMAIIVSLLGGSDTLANGGKVLSFVVLGAVLIGVLLASIRTEGLIQRFKENVGAGPNPLVLALLVYGVVSFFVSSTPRWLTMNEIVRVAICIAVYFGVAYNLKGRLTQMTDVIVGTSAAVAVFGLISVGETDFGHMGGVSGSFGTHEALGSFLMLMLPVTAAIGIFTKGDERRKLIARAASLLIVVCLAFTQSRSGWISEIVAISALALMAAKFFSNNTRTGAMQRFAAAAPFLAFAGLAGLLLAISGSGSDILHRASSFGSGSTDISWNQRLMLWHAAIAMIAAKPVFGWGLGSFPFVAAKFTPVAASASYVAAHGINLRNVAHDYYLQLAAETGLAGLGLYLGVVVTFFVTGYRALGKLHEGTRKTVLIGVMAAMAGQVVDALTSPSYNLASVSLFQWLLMGVAMFAAGVPRQSQIVEAPITEMVPTPYTAARRSMARALAVCGCITALMFTVSSSDSAIADSYVVTVTHNEGISDSGAILIGVGGLVAGYIIGYELSNHSNEPP